MKLMHDKVNVPVSKANLTAQGTKAWTVLRALDSFHETVFLICVMKAISMYAYIYLAL